MIKVKKIIALCLSVVMCCAVTNISYASETDMGNSQDNVNASVFQIERGTFKEKTKTFDIPNEVSEYIDKILSENENAEVTVYAPGSKTNTFSSSGSWGTIRTYKGFTLKDWNVHVTNSHGMTAIKTGALAYKFTNDMLIYGAGVLLDSAIPFGSAGITLVQFLLGNSSTVHAGSGDKASVSPRYTADAKFTYVNTGGEYLLGLRTHKAKLETITWYYYCDATHEDTPGKMTYNKTYSTSSFNNPDAKAIAGAGTGGYLEDPISIQIGDKDFVLD